MKGTFKAMWEDFLERSIHAMACPTFYQHVVDLVFHAHIKACYPISQPAQTAEDNSLNYEERNALRYAAGYVPRALLKKLERSSHQYKEEMILNLSDGNGGRGGSPTTDDSTEWVQAVDRGGLYHINQAT